MSEDNVVDFSRVPEAIQLRHLRAFVVVAEELNFGRAAERLFITQPALSRQIRALEQQLGVDVLRRSSHGVKLTLAGEALLDRARPILREVNATISAVQAFGDELVGRVARLWEPVAQAVAADADLQARRMAYERMLSHLAMPDDTSVTPIVARGVSSLLVGQGVDVEPTILYLHGGGYVLASAFGYRPMAGALALAAGSGVLVADYRLAPEHRFPAAVEDAVSAFRWILDQGIDAGEVTICGDSSGGGLAMSALLTLRERGLPQPGGVVLMCPWVDLALDLRQDEPVRSYAAAYLAEHPADDPIASPLRADLGGLAPLLIQAATGDLHLADANALADRAQHHGVEVQFERYPVDAHAFQLFSNFLPQGADAIASAGRFAQRARAAARAKSA